MIKQNSLNVIASGDLEIHVSRTFNAPRELVFRALTTPEMLNQWFGGPDGWELITCEFEARVGGSYRYVWRNERIGGEMGMGGTILEFNPPKSYTCTEHFDQAWYPGDARSTIELTEQGVSTQLFLTITYETLEARDAVLHSPMKEGMAIGYDRLEKFLETAEAKV